MGFRLRGLWGHAAGTSHGMQKWMTTFSYIWKLLWNSFGWIFCLVCWIFTLLQ